MSKFIERHDVDQDGNPAGGTTSGKGLSIQWHHGPRGEGEPNGATVELVLEAVIGRLRFFQDHQQLACKETAQAIRQLGMCAEALKRRTADREARGVEGTLQK